MSIESNTSPGFDGTEVGEIIPGNDHNSAVVYTRAEWERESLRVRQFHADMHEFDAVTESDLWVG